MMNKYRLALCVLVANSPAFAAGNAQLSPAETEAKVESLMSQMTSSDKYRYIHANNGYLLPPLSALGLVGTNSVDSSMGVRLKSTGQTFGTSYPSQTAVAATWNINRAKELGLALGYETRLSGAEHQLSPVVNLYRTPLNGRAAESICGEDPFLCSVMAPALTNGIQRQGVTSTVKHWLANEQEANRYNLNVKVDQRTLRELYMEPFESLVKNARVASVMCGFNYLNGVHSCSSKALIQGVLKDEWGFDGFVSSDYDSIVDPLAAANAGTDMDQPTGYKFTENRLAPYVESGELSQATIDDKVKRNLGTLVRFGFDEQTYDAQALAEPEHGRQASIDIAREGIVLLKNKGASAGQGGLLPLPKNARIAVIGEMARHAPASPFGTPYSPPASDYVTELGGLKALADNGADITFIEGMALSPENSRWYLPGCTRFDSDCQQGVKVEYFDNTTLAGTPVLTREESGVNFDWAALTNATAEGTRELTDVNPELGAFSTRVSTKFRPQIGGRQAIKVRADGPFKLWLDGELILQSDGQPHANENSLVVTLTKTAKTKRLKAGQLYNLRLEYCRERHFSARLGAITGLQMSWASLEAPSDLGDYDAVVAFVGRNNETEGETLDHDFTLPDRQGYLLEQVTHANPNTIVVMHGGGGMLMLPWANDAGAILHAWYSGQFGGQALAEILYGDVNPSGKLPITLDKWFKFNPSYASYHDPSLYYGDNSATEMTYSEGLGVGYRGYQMSKHKPLYPFGFGLSYTDFAFSGLSLSRATFGQNDIVNATFTVTNTGSRAGYETAQVYVAPKNRPVPGPDHELKGFAKVYLQAGESKEVTIPLNARSFSYYDVDSNRWDVPAGSQFAVMVGDSSEHLPLSAPISAPAAISVNTYYSNPLPTPVQMAVQVPLSAAY